MRSRILLGAFGIVVLLGAGFWLRRSPSPTPATASQQSPQAHLRKLSLHIRDLDPDRSEYAALEDAIRAGSTSAFFAAKALDYLRSPEHVDKMNYRLNEVFELRNSYAPFELMGRYDDVPERPRCGSRCYEDHNSLNALFRDVAARNLPWDEIFTARAYSVYDVVEDALGAERISDVGFYGALSPALPPSSDGIIRSVVSDLEDVHAEPVARIQFDPGDLRVAGAFTTARFFERYTNVAVNKNRRRAAAVFRIGLCDAMVPSVVQPDAKKTGELLSLALSHVPAPDHPGGEEAQPDLHGKQKDCMACHRKLDPAGRVFNHIGVALSEVPSPGALVYDDEGGQQVNIPVAGVGELMSQLVKQQKYAECQVQYFWQWFMGVDVPLDQQRLTELVVEFNIRQRRTNDFIAYLVSQPEFVGLPSQSDEVTFADVKATFTKCDGCHRTMTVDLPPLSVLPIGGSNDAMLSTLNRLVASLDLAHDGVQATMPPAAETPWRLTYSEMSTIKKWLQGGAKNERGTAAVNPTRIEWN